MVFLLQDVVGNLFPLIEEAEVPTVAVFVTMVCSTNHEMAHCQASKPQFCFSQSWFVFQQLLPCVSVVWRVSGMEWLNNSWFWDAMDCYTPHQKTIFLCPGLCFTSFLQLCWWQSLYNSAQISFMMLVFSCITCCCSWVTWYTPKCCCHKCLVVWPGATSWPGSSWLFWGRMDLKS